KSVSWQHHQAREQGAKGYVINSAGGNDQMFGTAIIYK
ncbi:YdgH/BhsA/McbA-like domain containing protein, partial [Escherichia coli]